MVFSLLYLMAMSCECTEQGVAIVPSLFGLGSKIVKDTALVIGLFFRFGHQFRDETLC